jgi:hypothetical protein
MSGPVVADSRVALDKKVADRWFVETLVRVHRIARASRESRPPSVARALDEGGASIAKRRGKQRIEPLVIAREEIVQRSRHARIMSASACVDARPA